MQNPSSPPYGWNSSIPARPVRSSARAGHQYRNPPDGAWRFPAHLKDILLQLEHWPQSSAADAAPDQAAPIQRSEGEYPTPHSHRLCRILRGYTFLKLDRFLSTSKGESQIAFCLPVVYPPGTEKYVSRAYNAQLILRPCGGFTEVITGIYRRVDLLIWQVFSLQKINFQINFRPAIFFHLNKEWFIRDFLQLITCMFRLANSQEYRLNHQPFHTLIPAESVCSQGAARQSGNCKVRAV